MPYVNKLNSKFITFSEMETPKYEQYSNIYEKVINDKYEKSAEAILKI